MTEPGEQELCSGFNYDEPPGSPDPRIAAIPGVGERDRYRRERRSYTAHLSLDELLARTAKTGEASTIHEPVGKPGGPGLWHHKNLQLPPYIQHVANELRKHGHDESKAVQMAVGIVKNWAAGHDGHGHQVHPDVQAAAAKNITQWEALKTRASKARRSTVTGAARAEMAAQSINDLPDSDFAYIEPGGTKDGSGKTVPRSLRHFPIHDAAHVRNALSRAPQSPFGDKAMPKIKAAAKKFGIDVSDDNSSSGSGSSGGGSSSRAEFMRMYPLENIEILRTERTGPDGRPGAIVEAYAAVFNTPAEIQDFEGHYIEEIDRSAFDSAIAFAQRNTGGLPGNVKVLYNHGLTVQGTPAPEFQLPIGVPVDIKPESRGLLTRTRYHTDDPFSVRVLENIRAGAITAQSFVGRIIRSDPQLRRGERYRPGLDGALRTVRRMKLGLREYGPVLWPAYSGAEILGVRMSTPGGVPDPDDDELFGDEQFEYALALPPDEGLAGADPLPEEEHSARYHQHALYALRSKEMRERIGLDW